MWRIEELGGFSGKGSLAGTDSSNDRDSSVQELLASRNLLKDSYLAEALGIQSSSICLQI